MKTNQFLLGLSLLLMCFFWSCTKDTLTTTDIGIIAPPPGGNGNGNNGNGGGNGGPGGGDGDSDPLWEVIYDGSIIVSTVAYGAVTTNNPKYELMGTDACGKFTFSGITTLNECASGFDFCVDGTGIRQWDLKKDPGHVANHLWILHPEGNLNFKMFGWLETGSTTIFPESGSVSIDFYRWELNSPDCNEETGDFDPGQASVTITRLAVSDCASTPDEGMDTCD